MPIYEYQCQKCTEEFEVLVLSFSQEYTPDCPECGSKEVKKAISLFSGSSGDSNDYIAPTCGPST